MVNDNLPKLRIEEKKTKEVSQANIISQPATTGQ